MRGLRHGSVIWKQWLGREIYGSPAYAYGRVYVGNEQMVVYVLDATTGEKLSFYELGGQVWSSPTPYNSRLYIGDIQFNVYCFEEDIPDVPPSSPPKWLRP